MDDLVLGEFSPLSVHGSVNTSIVALAYRVSPAAEFGYLSPA